MKKIHFEKVNKGKKVNLQYKGFNTEDQVSVSKTFIREFIQNSLDARISPNEKLIVNISILRNPQNKTLKSLSDELRVPISTSQSVKDSSSFSKDCLVIEEYGTQGLNGSLSPFDDSNHAHFWYTTGSFEDQGKVKSGTTLGGAGLGSIALYLKQYQDYSFFQINH